MYNTITVVSILRTTYLYFHTSKTAETLDSCKIVKIVIVIIITIVLYYDVVVNMATSSQDLHRQPQMYPPNIIRASSFRVGFQLYIPIVLLLPKKLQIVLPCLKYQLSSHTIFLSTLNW